MPICSFQCTQCETRFSLVIDSFEDELEACCSNCQSTKIFEIDESGQDGEACENCFGERAKLIGARCHGKKKC